MAQRATRRRSWFHGDFYLSIQLLKPRLSIRTCVRRAHFCDARPTGLLMWKWSDEWFAQSGILGCDERDRERLRAPATVCASRRTQRPDGGTWPNCDPCRRSSCNCSAVAGLLLRGAVIRTSSGGPVLFHQERIGLAWPSIPDSQIPDDARARADGSIDHYRRRSAGDAGRRTAAAIQARRVASTL